MNQDYKFSAFISHASEDADAAYELVQHLESQGYTCWMAPRDVKPGGEYGEEIIGGIRASKCLILLLSDAANESIYVRREVERAVSSGMPVFPLRLADVTPSPGIELFISTVQWVDAWERNWQDVSEQMIEILEGTYKPDVGRRKKRFNLSKAATYGGAVVSLLAIIFAYIAFSTKQPSTVSGTTTVSQISVEDLTRDDFRVSLFIYEELFGEPTWTIRLQMSPKAQELWSNITDTYTSYDGKNYQTKGNMGDVGSIKGEAARSSKEFYIKFKIFDGKEIGPFKYTLDYSKFAKESIDKQKTDMTRALEKEKAKWKQQRPVIKLRPPNSLFKIFAPESDEPSNLDVIGIRLGMNFDKADKIIRKHMKVGRTFVADRAWQTGAAFGNIIPYTSGRRYEAEDGGEVIIIFDEPPAAPGVVMGLVRQVLFSNDKIPSASITVNLKKKYGKPSGRNPSGEGQIWYEGEKTRGPSYNCVPSSNQVVNKNIWRNSEGSPVNWTTTLQYKWHTPSLESFTDPSDAAGCSAGITATFDIRQHQNWDRLVIQLFDQRAYARKFKESKRLIEKGESNMRTVKTGLDQKP